MDRSDSLLLLTREEVFLSLNLLSRLAPAVGASGGGRASQFPYGSFFACHALRPRQVSGDLTTNGLLRQISLMVVPSCARAIQGLRQPGAMTRKKGGWRLHRHPPQPSS